MKTIASKDNGNWLVEMTPREILEFNLLKEAAEGATLFAEWPFEPNRRLDFDEAASTFCAIRAWVMAQMDLNRMQATLDKLRQILEPEEAESAESPN